MWKSLIIFALGVTVTNSISPINEFSANALPSPDIRQQELTYRLPTNVRPLKYALNIHIDVENEVFNGNVSINLEVIEPTTSIHLNYKDLSVDWINARLALDASAETFPVINEIDRPTEQIYELHFQQSLNVGSYTLQLHFEGHIRHDLTGLYKSSYAFSNDSLSETRYLAATHLEPTYARSVFPCFDEPAFKAKFSVNIYHNGKYRAMSNMPREGEPELVPGTDNVYKTSFMESPVIMSTYLLAFVVAEEYEFYTESPGMLRVAASSHDIHRVKFSQNFGVKSIEWFEAWLDKDYQLPKLDMVNIPDFLFGAMENWGLILYRDPYLFRDEDDILGIPVRSQQSGALLITHELAHMWFGNEVTPEFWTFIWLSEGFARFFEYYVTDILLPSWHLMDQFLVTNFQSSLSQDDKGSVRAMTTDVVEPDVINDMFNYIVYAKSACVIRMFQHVTGIDIFQTALRSYLADRSFSTTNPDYLFNHFQNAIGNSGLSLPNTIKNLFETWSNHPGYQLVKVTRNTGSQTILFEQSRFFVNPSEAQGLSYPERWIPINFATSNNRNFERTTPDLWLSPGATAQSRTFDGPDNSAWIIVNKQNTGYYRVQYDQHNYDLLLAEVNSDGWKNIHVSNRAQLLDDAINLAKARHIDINIAFGFLNSLRRENDLPEAYAPWATAHNALTYLNGYLKGHRDYNLFQSFVASISREAYSNVQVNTVETRHLHRIHRLSAARWACLMGVQECVNDVEEIVDGMLDGSFEIIDEIKDFVYCTAVRYSDRLTTSLGTHLLTLFISTDKRDDQEINRIVGGLACSNDASIVEGYLQLIITSNPLIPVTAQDRQTVFRAIAGASGLGLGSALHFLTNNFLAVRNSLGADSLESIFNYLGPLMTSEDHVNHVNEIVENFATSLTAAQRNAAVAAVNRARENIEWLAYHGDSISQWLSASDVGGTANGIVVNSIVLLFAVTSSLRLLLA
ncbi:hypothetical protein HA402_011975 [Bradysia odoriphaga]|nr:hypothetical protein HA402_011975 [Bradysia odoriphaga]